MSQPDHKSFVISTYQTLAKLHRNVASNIYLFLPQGSKMSLSESLLSVVG